MILSGGLLKSADDQSVQVLLEIHMSYPLKIQIGGKVALIPAEAVWWYNLKLYWQSLTSIKSWKICFLAASRKSSHWEATRSPFALSQAEWKNKGLFLPLLVWEVREKNGPQSPINKNGAVSKASLIFWMYWKGHAREPSLGSLTVLSLFFMHQQFVLFNIWSVVRSAWVSHHPSTQGGKHTGNTYLTYFLWKGAKAQGKQAGTNLKSKLPHDLQLS